MMRGTNASAGIGLGKAVILKEAEIVIKRVTVDDREAEQKRFQDALAVFIENTERLAEDMATRIGEKEAEILIGQSFMMQDPELTGAIESAIANEGTNTEAAVEDVCNMYADIFASMDDELMQQRATDLRDIKTRIQKILLGVEEVNISDVPEGTVIIARDLTPSVTAGIRPERVSGIVTELGGRTSHSAILARALEIPAVVAVEGLTAAVKDGDQIVLDGSEGIVYVNPEDCVVAEYEAKRET